MADRFGRALWQLTLWRLRELLREPEAVFWVFVFPVIMALALGIAFRSRPVQKLHIAVEDRTPRAAELVARLAASPDLERVLLDRMQAEDRLRTGKIELIIGPREGDSRG